MRIFNQSTDSIASKELTADHGLHLAKDLPITKVNEIHFTVTLCYGLILNNIEVESSIHVL